MDMLPVRWGIMAPGKIANKFASDLNLFRKNALVSVASTNLERAQSFANKFGIPSWYGSYKEMLEKENLDVVYIASPHSFHFEQAKSCLEMGVSVLCEKPVTINAAQLQVLITLASQKGLFFMEALWSLFLPTFKLVFITIFFLIIFRNSSKSIVPEPSLSISYIILAVSAFVASNPKASN